MRRRRHPRAPPGLVQYALTEEAAGGFVSRAGPTGRVEVS